MSEENGPFPPSNQPGDEARRERRMSYLAIAAMEDGIVGDIFTYDSLPEGDGLLQPHPLPRITTLMERASVLLDQPEQPEFGQNACLRASDILERMRLVTESYTRYFENPECLAVFLGGTVRARVKEIMVYDDIKYYTMGIEELKIGLPPLMAALRFAADFPEL